MSKQQQKPAAAKAAKPAPAAPKAAKPAPKLATGWAEVADRDDAPPAPAWPVEDGIPVPEPDAAPEHIEVGFTGTARGAWPTEDA